MYNSGTMQQEEECHPYMSLYEPLLLSTSTNNNSANRNNYDQSQEVVVADVPSSAAAVASTMDQKRHHYLQQQQQKQQTSEMRMQRHQHQIYVQQIQQQLIQQKYLMQQQQQQQQHQMQLQQQLHQQQMQRQLVGILSHPVRLVDQSPLPLLPPRIYTTTSATTASFYNRAKKRQYMMTTGTKAATKIDYIDKNVAENHIFQHMVHKDETASMATNNNNNNNNQVALLETRMVGDDNIDIDVDYVVEDEDQDDCASFDSNDDEDAVTQRMKTKSAKKKSGAKGSGNCTDFSDNNNTNIAAKRKRRSDMDKNDEKWEGMYERLVAYKMKHNDNTNSLMQYKKDPKLGIWANNQRYAYRTNKIFEERKRLLNSIGFAWGAPSRGTYTATWEAMLQRLVAYKKEHNNTKVPQHYNKDPKLGAWVNHQRQSYKKRKLTEDRVRVLNSIGFGLNTMLPRKNRVSWEEMYRRLVAYKTVHKDANVPQRYKKDPSLGHWVANQRYKFKTLTEERKCLLNSIGFAWKDLKWIRQQIHNKNVLETYDRSCTLGLHKQYST